MTVELDTDAIEAIPLNDDAMDAASDAATDAFVAGLEEYEQLEAGIKAYLWYMQTHAREH